MAEFVTQTIDNATHGFTVQKAMEKLGLRDKRDLIPGMEVRLLPHQTIGVAWMVDQERNSKNRGGILADDMGLGKTVQMIATMAINQPSDEDKHRTTLVIVPAALLLQWKEEIESKTNNIFDVHIHHGKDKLKSVSALREKDVIITTYQTLNLDFAVPGDVEEYEEMDWLYQNGGHLARMKWYRVITDEAQFIRNRATRSSKAVAMLRAKYRWCLTGTPVTNTLADIYGLIRFGHFRPWNHWEDFNSYIAKVQLEDAPLAGLRAQEVLKPLLLRRTKNSQLEGRPLLELPPKDIELVMVDFSEDEREIYQKFEQRAQISLNKFIRNHSVVKKYVLILRLRQLCCHPNLILGQLEDLDDPTLMVGSDSDKELSRATKAMGSLWVQNVSDIFKKIKRKFLERARASRFDYDDEDVDEEPTCPVCGDLFMSDTGRVLACGDEICFDCMMDLKQAPISHDGIFGYGDEKANMEIEKQFETAAAQGLRPCPTCKKMMDLGPNKTFKSSAFEPSEEDFNLARRKLDLDDLLDMSDSSDEEMPDISSLIKSAQEQKSSPGPRIKGKGNKVIIDSDDESDGGDILDIQLNKHKQKAAASRSSVAPSRSNNSADPGQPRAEVIETWRRGDYNMEASAKMLALIDYLREWDSCGDKTIVYSQWTSMLDLVEILFSRHGIQNLRYDGKMNREAREATLARFRKSGGPKVILVSTKCGGVGLNLVSANRVINLDLSWNYASESQAYDRVHRLGQEKPVFVKRFVVRDTIEDRMLQLQDTKTGLSDAALGEGGGIKLHKLSVKELRTVSIDLWFQK
ncbi:SNF2 family N-terminal domain-containing protein [Abortiporus biennis]|nr:SNF2 family N-terminal domain-containing protein [Abortiporus biennis]